MLEAPLYFASSPLEDSYSTASASTRWPGRLPNPSGGPQWRRSVVLRVASIPWRGANEGSLVTRIRAHSRTCVDSRSVSSPNDTHVCQDARQWNSPIDPSGPTTLRVFATKRKVHLAPKSVKAPLGGISRRSRRGPRGQDCARRSQVGVSAVPFLRRAGVLACIRG